MLRKYPVQRIEPCSCLERRVVSLCGRGAEVAMHGRIHQSVVLRKTILPQYFLANKARCRDGVMTDFSVLVYASSCSLSFS